MHAVVLGAFGGADRLVPGEFPTPVAEPGWLVVRLLASALNWHDVLVRQGRYGSRLPHVIGADGAGVRDDDGEPVMILPSLWWGDEHSAPGPRWEILGDHQPGTYAELVRVPSDCVLPKPAHLSFEQAAALPLVGLTAYRALFSRGRLRAGESLLVLGAGGGVATTAVTLATAIGAVPYVTSSSATKVDLARGLGARDGVLFTDTDWVEQARAKSPGGNGFDLVLDSVGCWADAVRVLRPGGRLVVLGASQAESATMDVRAFYFGQYELLGTTMGSRRDFTDLLELMSQRHVAPPVVDRVFPMDHAAQAHEYLERGGNFGKVVLAHT